MVIASRKTSRVLFVSVAFIVAGGGAWAWAQQAAGPEPRLDEGPTRVEGARGYSHPNQYMHVEATLIAENMEPVIPHPDEEARARRKLGALEQKVGKKPNIVVFLMDDVGWMDFGFNGGGVAVGNPTPNADRYAANGLILTSAYSQPTCSPTRATILTGQLPVHHGILSPPMYGQPGGLEGAITLPKLLSDLGYTTQCIGKWHCGENEGSQPQNVGFDDFRGFLSVSDMYTEWRDPGANPEIALSPERTAWVRKIPFNKNEVHAVKGGRLEELREIDVEVAKNLDQDWCRYGEEFIRRQKGSDKPFFLYYNTRAAHIQNYPNEYYEGRSPARTTYSDVIVEIDDVFGRLMKALEETGQDENTLVIFTSDNGPEAESPPYGRTAFRGSKGSTWEGGVRVPTFVYWKGMVDGGRKSDGLYDLADIFNTSLALAGKPGEQLGSMVPKDRYIDGIDQASFLLGDRALSNRKGIIYFLNENLAGARVDEFKIITWAQLPTAVTQRGQQGGVTGTIGKTASGLLFNLYTNPQEDDSVVIEHIPAAVGTASELDRYGEVIKKFPVRVQIKLY